RLTGSGIEISDATFAPILADMSGTDPAGDDGAERHAVRQLAALLYALLTNTTSQSNPQFDLHLLGHDIPSEFRVI
ncbi:hypothetical protein LIP47_16810, partial [Eggerthella lenta]|nr:hypothetical protein [Eggerthella lenta]